MKKYLLLLIALLPLVGLSAGLSAQTLAQAPCSSPFHRQFDFWLGEWDVYHTQADTVVGYNHIKSILNGCVVEENWTGATGFAGKSFNTYSPSDSSWKQVWVDVGGATYHFSGRYKDNIMDMKGSTNTPKGEILFHMTYHYDSAKDTIRQVWKQSTDGGEKWATIFDGTYKKRTASD